MLGTELRDMRVMAGIKAKDLAMELGIADATLSRYENGHKDIPKLVQLATRYVCEKATDPLLTPGERIIEALKEAIDYGTQQKVGHSQPVA